MDLDDGSGGDDGVFDDDDNPVPDDVPLVLGGEVLLDAVLVRDAAIHADACVLIDDGVLDGGASADADGGAARERLALVLRLVVIRAHDEGVLDGAILFDARAEADDGVLDGGALDEAAVADDGVHHLGLGHLGRREEAALGVDGGVAVVEGEVGRFALGEREVGAVKGADGSDVLPVSVKEVSLHVVAEVLRARDDLPAKVERLRHRVLEELPHHLRLEDVDAHRGDVRHLLGALRVEAEDGGVAAHRRERVALRLFRKLHNLARVVNLHDAERRGALLVHRERRHRDVGAALAVLHHEILVVHAVEVVPGQNQVVLGVGLAEEPLVLANSVRRALEPVGPVRRLLRREHLHKPLVLVVAHVGVVRL
mmetsp:Transcript_13711/g.45106  ORF Transcript_13711/g.45106 Transcript_13711/m.45106 type:complete len:368 (-) Transcript_13711:407-1510(-)